MSRLSNTQQQIRSAFLAETLDGRLDKPVADGSGLPNMAYTSDDFYQLEQQTVFRDNWVFAGFQHQLKNTGDMVPCDVAGQPVLLVKTDTGDIKAFHNVCRHRGAQLVTTTKQATKIVCPNHAWSYALDGTLIARPHFFGGDQHDINREPCHRANLSEIACARWFDWIFINLSNTTDEFDTAIEPIKRHLGDYQFDALQYCDSLQFTIAANWKLAIENFIEPYHVFSCHPWLNDFVGMNERVAPAFDGKVLSCGYQFQKSDPVRGGALPWFPNLPANKQNRGDWYVLFPNFGFQVFPDQVAAFIAEPQGSTTCRETIALYFIDDNTDTDKHAEARALVIQNWHDLNHEDIGIIERMQTGRTSEGFDGGVLSPYWDPVQQHFARLMTEAVQCVDV